MSFSKDIKKEILENGFKSNSHCLAFLCGLVCSSAEYEVDDNKVKNFHIITDLDFLAKYLKIATNKLYGACEIICEPCYKISNMQYYDIKVADALAKNILLDTKALFNKNGSLELNDKIDESIISGEDDLSGFISGAFIGCGTSSIKLENSERTTTGYHLELGNQNYSLLRSVLDILAEFEILAKLTQRKSLYVLYIKDAEAVSNALALMGASDAVLKLQNEIITRQMRNKINRQNNCYTSNYTKTLNASFKQLDAINLIDKEIGINELSEDLQQVALLRLANTEESLEELLKLSKYPMTKSALNHKFNKLIKIAEKLKEK